MKNESCGEPASPSVSARARCWPLAKRMLGNVAVVVVGSWWIVTAKLVVSLIRQVAATSKTESRCMWGLLAVCKHGSKCAFPHSSVEQDVWRLVRSNKVRFQDLARNQLPGQQTGPVSDELAFENAARFHCQVCQKMCATRPHSLRASYGVPCLAKLHDCLQGAIFDARDKELAAFVKATSNSSNRKNATSA